MAVIEQYVDNGLAVITLNNSENGNRLGPLMLDELHRVLADSCTDPAVRVVLLRSNGSPFSLGMDLKPIQQTQGTEDRARAAIARYGEVLEKLYTSPKPVVALVDGEVKAGGVGLVAAADIVLATEDATFQLSEVFFGLIPANVLPYLLSLRMSPQKARYLVLTAKQIDAGEACSLGIVDEVYPRRKFEREVKKTLKNLFRSSPTALAEAKEFTVRLPEMGYKQRLEYAQSKLRELLEKEEISAAVQAFEEGELPHWFEAFKPSSPLTCIEEQEGGEK